MKKQTKTDLRSHFGLGCIPFTREIPVRERFSSPLFDEPLAQLCSTVEARMSAALIAPPGTGKSMLLRCLCEQLPQARYRLHQVHVTSLSKRDMYREIATAVGIETVGTYAALLRRLQHDYRSRTEQDGLRAVLLIDEAQDMRPDVLATLRILTNFNLDSRLILSLVLSGDNRLQTLLASPGLEPLRQRLAHVATLRLLSREETTKYIEHRLAVAGATDEFFDEEARDAVFEITRGNLRAINHICRKAMEAAMREGIKSVGTSLIIKARQSLLL